MNESLGKLGIWANLDPMSLEQAAEFAVAVEQMGYGTLWMPEAVGRDPFVMISHLSAATSSLLLATGIANIYARDAMAMQAIRNSLNELNGGRLVLGLGASHAELVDSLRGHEYGKPVSTMRAYLEKMEQAVYIPAPPAQRGPLLLAALRKNMLGLAAAQADGAHPYFVNPEHTARAREILGPDKLLAPEQAVLTIRDPSEARRVARAHMATYIGLPNYRNNLLALDFTEEDFEDGGSDRLVDAIVAWGDEHSIMDRIEAHWRNGADHVALQCLGHEDTLQCDLDAVRAFAPRHGG